MVDDGRHRLTRRRMITSGGAAMGAGLLAGCGSSSGSETTTDPERDDTGMDGTPSEDEETTTAAQETPYEACIEPAGCLTFQSVPETYVVYNGAWADMAFALGQRDGFLTAGNMIPGFFFEPFGLDVPPQSELPALANWDGGGWNKEIFYELDPDVVLMDPNYLHGTGWDKNWDESDTEEIAQKVAPFFGNNCRRRREFHDYKLYSLYGAFERAAALFRQQGRYEALKAVHDELQATIADRLPAKSERPSVGLINGGSDPSKGQFYPLDPQDEGYEMKPYRDLDVQSGFPDSMEGGQTDYEGLLEADPEIILVHWGIGTTSGDVDGFDAATFREKYVTPMEEDSLGSQLTAVQEGQIYPGQYGEQGPLVNLLQTEMVAQQLYPAEFGAFAPERFPDVPEDRRLFDRQRVRDIIAGEF